ncbi:hypothetical protein NDU88_011299 [Pleurodeles waltl]|uniref:Uncharacterized protein n=1 Tax=Pleurodeles waltl TaxID=8319 RepID=A0AAV7QZZ9_PLEWA|nr:hypothetical protein NDU88_011299 [Pleurodeles waltl]
MAPRASLGSGASQAPEPLPRLFARRCLRHVGTQEEKGQCGLAPETAACGGNAIRSACMQGDQDPAVAREPMGAILRLLQQ